MGFIEHIKEKKKIPSVYKNLECTFSIFKEKQYPLEKPETTVPL